ncbi:MAG TPA: DUF4136 domain-containing protein [Chitinophagaceae bacterium]|nr:DUF4136 domain-containing protein [Chitinophagaceae bacterium]
MKKMKIVLAALFMGGILLSCSSPVYVQKDDTVNFSNYKTYMWVETRASETDQTARPVSYADPSVKNAVNAELTKIGWRESTDNPDVLVSYDVLVERTVEQRSDPVYSQPFSRVYYNPFRKRWATVYYPSQFLGYNSYDVPVKEGTVSISLMDANLDKTVWQGWTTETLNYSRITDDEIQKSVRNIFSKFDMASR